MRRALALLLLLAAVAAADEREIIEGLRSPDGATRSRGQERLLSLPPSSRVSALRAVLREVDSEGYVGMACFQLGQLGPVAVPAVPELIETAFASSEHLRIAALDALAAMGVSAWQVDGLLEELREENYAIRRAANRALASIGVPDRPEPDPLANEPWRLEGQRLAAGAATLAELGAALKHDHAYVRHHAARSLALRGPDGLSVLAQVLKSSEGGLKIRVLTALASSRDPRVIPALLEVLRNDQGRPLEIAIEALGVLEAPEAEAGILDSLRDADLSRASAAIPALERIRPGASAPVIRAWFESPDPDRVDLAFRMLSSAPACAPEFVPELIQALYTVRRGTALAVIAKLGPKAAEAGPFLVDLRRGRDDYRLDQAIRATGAGAGLADPLPESASTDELLAALRGENWLNAGFAARRFGAAEWNDEVGQALAQALHHPKAFVVDAAFQAFRKHGAAAVPALAEALANGSLEIRRRSLLLLTELGAASAGAADAVVAALDVPELKWPAVEWIKRVGPPAAAAAPKLIRWYREADRLHGYEVALAAIGEAGSEIIPDLILELEDEQRAWAAATALRVFGPHAGGAAPALGRLVLRRYKEVPNPRSSHIVIEAIAALAYVGEPGAKQLIGFLQDGDADLIHLVTKVFHYHRDETPALLLTFWELRESENKKVRAAAMGYLRRTTVLARLEDDQLRVLFEISPDKPQIQSVAGELMRRADVAGLIEGLKSERVYLRRAAFNFLKARKEEAAPALPTLAELASKETNVRQKEAILQLICDVAGEGAQPYIVEFVRQAEGFRNFDLGYRRLKGYGDFAYLGSLLGDKDERIRKLAGKTLSELRPRPSKALRESLSANLRDPPLRTTYTASILASWGAESAPLFVELLRSLKDSEYRVAVPHLEKMGAAALPALRVALADKHPSVRSRTVYLMEKCGSAADDDLLKTLRGDRHEDVREATVRALARRGAKAAPLILPALEDPARDVRTRAWYFVRENPETIESAVPLLIRSLSKPEWRKETIERLKYARDSALPLLEAAAKSGQDSDAVLALAELGVVEEKSLRPLLASDDEETQLRAVCLLAQLGPSAEASVPSLLALLHSPRRETVEEAVRTLGCLGPAARPAVDRILAVRHGERSPLKDAVAVALTRIEHPPLVLVDLLKAGSSGLNNEVWRALRQGKIASLPELMALAECKDTDIARKAIPLIGELGPAAKAAIPVLKRVAANRNIGGYANAALAKIQPK